MFVYVSMMIWAGLCGLFSQESKIPCIIEGKIEKRTSYFFAFLSVSYITIIMGTLYGCFDLPAYELSFDLTPVEPSEISNYIDKAKYPGFFALQIIFKCFVSSNFHYFTLFIVAIDCFIIAYIFRKYSSGYALSIFIFIASGKVLWLGNAVKQFLATCIILAFSKFLFEKKFLPFLLGVLFASLFHTTALIIIPFYFFVHGKPWNKKMLLILAGALLSITFVASFTNILESLLEETSYGDSYTNALEKQSGSNILHFLIAAVPAVIALVGKKQIDEKAPNYINVCINMSIISACIYLISSFTSGILIGRLPIYFQMYSFIAFPWIIDNSFDRNTAKAVKIACVVCYLILYYLVFWESPYYSKILNIYITP